ncbi:hypothetical protein EKH55_4383 [Sinorhizobium alkalisoli]|nr:hypothetical protein EKH55_4383 [Sinorhizobium alkalisoli]
MLSFADALADVRTALQFVSPDFSAVPRLTGRKMLSLSRRPP